MMQQIEETGQVQAQLENFLTTSHWRQKYHGPSLNQQQIFCGRENSTDYFAILGFLRSRPTHLPFL